jgi:hypothetical protein
VRAWPARYELQVTGIAEGLPGAVMLVSALWLGAEALWLAVPLVVLLLLPKWPVRWTEKRLTKASKLDGVVSASLAFTVLRCAPEPLLTVLFAVVVARISPLLLGLLGVVGVTGAVLQFAQARAVARWELSHGGRVLRTGDDFIVV